MTIPFHILLCHVRLLGNKIYTDPIREDRIKQKWLYIYWMYRHILVKDWFFKSRLKKNTFWMTGFWMPSSASKLLIIVKNCMRSKYVCLSLAMCSLKRHLEQQRPLLKDFFFFFCRLKIHPFVKSIQHSFTRADIEQIYSEACEWFL